MTKIFILLLAISLLFLNSCYYDTESLLYPTGATTCDTTNITYSGTVKSILVTNTCLSCHSGSAASGGNIALDTYTNLKVYAQNGKLYGSINHDAGYVAMPQSGSKLSTCDIKKVKIWIDAGAPNN